MSNTYLSPTAITKEALALLHNNLVFCKSINRQYDSQFANSGATMSGKIGPSLNIRMPNRYTVRTGAALQLQDNVEQYQTLTMSTQKGVDINFTSQDLTLTIDEFSDRYLKPAMAQLASTLDYDALSMAADVYHSTGTPGTQPSTAKTFLNAGALMSYQAAPRDGSRSTCVTPTSEALLVDSLKGLFHSASDIAAQYEAGEMGTAFGFTHKMSQNINTHTCGTRVASSDYTVDGTQTEAASTMLITGTTGKTIKKGDRFQVADCYSVNPETRISTGNLQWFVATADATEVTGTHYSVPISPAMISTGQRQNINALPQNGKAVTFVGAASAVIPQNIAFHKDAFTLVTADLVIPKGVDFAAREVYDGISMRIVRAYDINNDRYPTRIDVLYGYKTLYPQWACVMSGTDA